VHIWVGAVCVLIAAAVGVGSDSRAQEGQTRVAAVERSLERIAAGDSRWKATVVVLAQQARAEAREADALRPAFADGPLDGLVITVKDNIEVEGVVTSAGARALQALGPVPRDATVVQRLRRSGAIVAATTNMDTYARGVRGVSEVRGQTVNPLRPKRNAGGSSAGAAASVAARYVDLALGTDTCGSVRYPAAAVGIFGLRPGQGLVSRGGVVPLSPTQDEVGILTSRPELIEPAFTVMAGPDPRDPTVTRTMGELDARPVARVGVVRSLGRWRIGADGTTALDLLRSRGITLIEIELPPIPNPSVINDEALPSRKRYIAARTATGSGAGSTGAHSGSGGAAGPDPWLDPARPLDVADQASYRARLRTRSTVRARLVDTMNRYGVDALVLPTSTADPALLGAPQPSGNCHLAATSGLPALAMPGPKDASGVPVVGAEVLGPVGSELSLARLAVSVGAPS
jgi:amidase